jgi:hypothetical protein
VCVTFSKLESEFGCASAEIPNWIQTYYIPSERMMVVMEEVVGQLIRVKEDIAATDSDRVFPYFLPEVRASPTQVSGLERATNFELAGAYKAFLLLANGWRYVLIRTSLLSADEIPPSHQAVLQRTEALSCLGGRGVWNFLVIGTSDADDNLYVLDVEGRVHWYAHGEMETFGNFQEFLRCLLAHNEELLAEVRDGRWRL